MTRLKIPSLDKRGYPLSQGEQPERVQFVSLDKGKGTHERGVGIYSQSRESQTLIFFVLMRYVYMLRCKDKTLYTWITNDLEKRIFDHNNSKVWARYTKSRRPVNLVRSKRAKDKVTAMKLEYKTKRFPKAKKEKLVKSKKKKTKKTCKKYYGFFLKK